MSEKHLSDEIAEKLIERLDLKGRVGEVFIRNAIKEARRQAFIELLFSEPSQQEKTHKCVGCNKKTEHYGIPFTFCESCKIIIENYLKARSFKVIL